MGEKSKNILKEKFKTGYKPSQQDFEDLIDSALNVKDTRIMLDENTSNLGIGTEQPPKERLEVNGAVRLGGTSSNNPGTIRWNPDTGDLEGYNGDRWLSLTKDSGGWTNSGAATFHDENNVGIGTDAPEQKLHVNGGLKLGFTTEDKAGTIRWNGEKAEFEGFDGTAWRSFIPDPQVIAESLPETGTGNSGSTTEVSNTELKLTPQVLPTTGQIKTTRVGGAEATKLINEHFVGLTWVPNQGNGYYVSTNGQSATIHFYDDAFDPRKMDSSNRTYFSVADPGAENNLSGGVWDEDTQSLWVAFFNKLDGNVYAHAYDISKEPAIKKDSLTYQIEGGTPKGLGFAKQTLYYIIDHELYKYKWDSTSKTYKLTKKSIPEIKEASAFVFADDYFWVTGEGLDIFKMTLFGNVVGSIRRDSLPNSVGDLQDWTFNGSNIVAFNASQKAVYRLGTSSFLKVPSLETGGLKLSNGALVEGDLVLKEDLNVRGNLTVDGTIQANNRFHKIFPCGNSQYSQATTSWYKTNQMEAEFDLLRDAPVMINVRMPAVSVSSNYYRAEFRLIIDGLDVGCYAVYNSSNNSQYDIRAVTLNDVFYLKKGKRKVWVEWRQVNGYTMYLNYNTSSYGSYLASSYNPGVPNSDFRRTISVTEL